MQDKEFDKLFSTKLDSYEVEPSKAVWQGISEELGGNKRRKLIPFLSIAASIIILVAAGVLFITKKDNVVKRVKHEVVNNHPSKTIPVTVDKQLPVVEASKTILVAANTKGGIQYITKNETAITAYRQNIPALKQIAAKAPEQGVLAAASSSKSNVTQSSVIDSGKMIAAAPTVQEQPEKAVILASVTPDKEKPADNPPVKKHRVRSFGDVLNVMIAAVDKRKDKIVEFSNTDGDESSITGINLGIIKIKKEN